MYAPAPAAGSAVKRGIWPVAAICCLGVLGLLLAATIILALIPVYLRRNTQPIGNVNTFNLPIYLQYQANANADTSTTGSVDNIAAITAALNAALGNNNFNVLANSAVQAKFTRRKRAHGRARDKRDLFISILFVIQAKFSRSCLSTACQKNVYQGVVKACQRAVPISSLTISIRRKVSTLSSLVTNTYTGLTFIGLFNTIPIGFGGEPLSGLLIFVAVSSGLFTNPATWANGIVPYGPCSVTIPAGITVSLPRLVLDLNVVTANVFGTLVVGGPGFPSFTFQYPTNIITYSGGTLQDQTSSNQIYAVPGSIITLYPGANFVGTNTVISTYTGSPTAAASNVIQSITLGSSASGPFTCGLLPSGQITVLNKVEFFAVTSGDFTSPGTWLGGIVPTAQVAALVGGLALEVVSGCTLSTAGLNGILNIQFDTITVDVGAVIQIGTPGLTTGFKFGFPTVLQVFGQCASVVGVASTIFFPVGSAFNLYAGSSFISAGVTITISSYIVGTGVIVGTTLNLASGQTVPYFITISLSGVITTSTTVPATGGTTAATTASSVTGGSVG